MPDSVHEYGLVNRLQAQAFGVPGRRTFRVLAANDHDAASLWLEKTELAALGDAIGRELQRRRRRRDVAAPDPDAAFSGDPTLDFRVAQLALGYDPQEGLFLLFAYTPEDRDPNKPTFSCQATPGQFRALAEEIGRVVAAGRPNCPLCGQPMDPDGHACARTNGHLKQPIPPLQTDDED